MPRKNVGHVAGPGWVPGAAKARRRQPCPHGHSLACGGPGGEVLLPAPDIPVISTRFTFRLFLTGSRIEQTLVTDNAGRARSIDTGECSLSPDNVQPQELPGPQQPDVLHQSIEP